MRLINSYLKYVDEPKKETKKEIKKAVKTEPKKSAGEKMMTGVRRPDIYPPYGHSSYDDYWEDKYIPEKPMKKKTDRNGSVKSTNSSKGGKVYYIAYGSNIYKNQMTNRCPSAKVIGKGTLDGYKLVFRRSCSGYYASLDRAKGSTVPIIIYEISKRDEKVLDRYEGCPVYYKKHVINFTLDNKEKVHKGIVYILPEKNWAGLPSNQYYERIALGYKAFKLDKKYLADALNYTGQLINKIF